MNGVIKNKTFLLIKLIIFLFSCEKTELNEVEELIGEILPKRIIQRILFKSIKWYIFYLV